MTTLTSENRSWRLDALFIGILIFIAGVPHAVFQFGGLYGEHDAARFLVDGIIWAKTGVRSIALSEYRYFVSPAFIYLAKVAYEIGVSTGIHPEALLDAATNIAAVLLFIPAYLLFANLLGSTAAFVACLYLEIIPAFWFSGLYGFPTLISLLFVVLALWLWDEFLLDRVIFKQQWIHLSFVFVAALVGTLLKADILTLTAPAFAGLVLVRCGVAWKPMITAVVLVSAAIVAGYGIGHALVQDSAQAAQYAAAWNKQFEHGNAAGIGMGQMRFVDELRLYVMSLGLLTLPAVLAALGMMLFEKQRALAIAIAIWLPTSFLFWAWRPGDGSRHHVPAAVPAALAIGYLFAVASRSRFRFAIYGFLGLVVLVNCFRYKPSANVASPSGRLFASARLVEQDAVQIKQKADAYVASNCRAVLLGSPLTPYAEADLLLSASQFTIKAEQLDGYLVRQIDFQRGDRQCQSLNVRILSQDAAAKAAQVFAAEGKTVRSYEYALPE